MEMKEKLKERSIIYSIMLVVHPVPLPNDALDCHSKPPPHHNSKFILMPYNKQSQK